MAVFLPIIMRFRWLKGFEATLLWMDDSRLEVGKEYLVKVGTKKIAGVVKSIEFKTDVNTGEHLHAGYYREE